MQAMDLAVLVIGGYVLIKYGPQIAQNLQAGQAPLTGIVGAPAAAPGATGIAELGQPGASEAAQNVQTGAAAPAASPNAFARTPCPDPNTCQSTINPTTGQCVCQGTADCPANGCNNLRSTSAPTIQPRFQAAPTAPTISPRLPKPSSTAFTQNPPESGCKTSAQDAACGFKGHPKCCANNTLLGGIVQTATQTGPGKTVSTRTPKSTPTHVVSAPSTLNPQCEGNPCSPPATPGQCLQASTGNLVKCTKPATAAMGRVVRSYHTQIVNGRQQTTIDPFFPAGFYLSQANYRSSLREPALH